MKIWVYMGVLTGALVAAFVAAPLIFHGQDKMVRHIAIGAKIRGLDPQDIGDTISSTVGGQMFETLYTYAYLERPYKLIPLLAESMPKISADGLTWTIPIKKGVRFADDEAFPGGTGRELVAEDFVYAWKRMADINNRSSNYSAIFLGYVQGLDDFRDYTSTTQDVDYARPLEDLKAVDAHTLQIKLTKPHQFLTYWLAHLPTAPMASEVVRKYGKEVVNHPVGTGPYVIEGDFRSNGFAMVRNRNYPQATYPERGEPTDQANGFLNDAGKPVPFIDRAEWSVIEEEQPRWLAFMSGQLDSSGIPKDSFHQAIAGTRELSPEMKAKGIKLLIIDDPTIFYYGFNMDDAVVGKLKPLRQAMSMAFDRATFIDKFVNGRGKIPVGPIPPMFAGFRPDKVNPYVRFDLAKARELKAQAEKDYGKPIPPLKMAMGGVDTTARQDGEFFQIQMKQIGLDVEVDYMTWPRFQDATKTRSHQIFQLGWVADFPDAQNFLLLFYGPNKSPGPNSCNYVNQKFDELYDRMMNLPAVEQRVPLYQQMEDLVIEDCPWILTEYPIGYVLYYDWLHNYKPNDFAQGTLKYQRVDEARRVQAVGRAVAPPTPSGPEPASRPTTDDDEGESTDQ